MTGLTNFRIDTKAAVTGAPNIMGSAAFRNLFALAGFQAAALAGTGLWLTAETVYQRYSKAADPTANFEIRDHLRPDLHILKRRSDKTNRPYPTIDSNGLPLLAFGGLGGDGVTRGYTDNGAVYDPAGGALLTGGYSISNLIFVPSSSGTVYGVTMGGGYPIPGGPFLSNMATHPAEAYGLVDPSTGFLSWLNQYSASNLAYSTDVRGSWHQVDMIGNPTSGATPELAAQTAILRLDGTTVQTVSSDTKDFDASAAARQLLIGALGGAFTGNGGIFFWKSTLYLPNTKFADATVAAALRTYQLTL